MNRKKKLKGISIKSFVTSELSSSSMNEIAGGIHPDCPTDGGPDTLAEGDGCYDLSTTPGRTCIIIM